MCDVVMDGDGSSRGSARRYLSSICSTHTDDASPLAGGAADRSGGREYGDAADADVPVFHTVVCWDGERELGNSCTA